MSAHDKLLRLLPSLWRPQADDRSLLADWLSAVGSSFDAAAADTQHVLRAHWADTADAALWAAHYQSTRREQQLAPVNVRDARDFAQLQRYPWVRDLARMGALLDLPPWRDPASLRENVEEYRQRLGDVVDAYRAGLCTVTALCRLVDAALQENMAAPRARQRSRFSIEEAVSLRFSCEALRATPTVEEGDRVAPLTRWALTTTESPTFIIAGTPADEIAAPTEQPMIERYTPGAIPIGIGVAWLGTVPAGQALRLLPSRMTWTIRNGALHASALESADNAFRDPSANGPWTETATLSAGRARALASAPDGSLWVIQRTQQTWRVQRFNGSAFAAVETDAPTGPFNALLCHGDSAWLGTDAGLFRCRLWATDSVLRWSQVTDVSGAIRALCACADELYAAGAEGLWTLSVDGLVSAREHTSLDLFAYCRDGEQALLATANALFIHRQGQYWRYEGKALSENQPDWVAEASPSNALHSPLPALTAMASTADGSLWLASQAGLARWHASAAGTTQLEAYPDLIGTAVAALSVDTRGMLWIGAANGLFRFDGRDLAQHDFAVGAWLGAGRADTAYPDDFSAEARGHWRFERTSGRWQRWSAVTRRFADTNLPDRAQASDAIDAVLPLPALRAELGQWDGTQFTPTTAIPNSELCMRIKPDETRIVSGAMATLPAIGSMAGETWRYLQMDDAPVPPTSVRPWWSKEAQLFPPPLSRTAQPGHFRTAPEFLDDAQGEGQFDHIAFAYPPSARLWVIRALAPAVGIRIRLCLDDPERPVDPALAERVWKLVARARPAGVPMQLMVEGRIMKESTS